MTPVMVSMPELMMRPAAKAVAVTAMAMSTTMSSRPNRPGAAFDLEVMALHFGSGRSLKACALASTQTTSINEDRQGSRPRALALTAKDDTPRRPERPDGEALEQRAFAWAPRDRSCDLGQRGDIWQKEPAMLPLDLPASAPAVSRSCWCARGRGRWHRQDAAG